MAHFAELDENNRVIQVLVVDNQHLLNSLGQEEEQLGILFLKNIFGETTRWVQTSYNNSFRVRYAGQGYYYDPALDAFIPPNL